MYSNVVAADFTWTVPRGGAGLYLTVLALLLVAWILVRGSVSGLEKITKMLGPLFALVVFIGVALLVNLLGSEDSKDLTIDGEVVVEPRTDIVEGSQGGETSDETTDHFNQNPDTEPGESEP